ncbi:MAG: hypothetical protein ACE5I7_13125 [Candidatus Binatia bacterium]
MTTTADPRAADTVQSRWHTPRPLPGVRAIRTMLRTAHLIAFGTLYGGHIYSIAPDRLHPALLATIATGAALMGLEVYRTPLWLVQVRGLATMVKIALVVAVALWWDVGVVFLTAAIVIGGVTSHMPGRYRYYSIVHGRSIGEQESG